MNDTRPDLAAIKARADAATEGPWTVKITGGIDYTDEGWCQVEVDFADPLELHAGLVLGDHENAEPDAEFIAHARADVPALLAEVERLRRAVERLLADAEDVPTVSMRHVARVLRAALTSDAES